MVSDENVGDMKMACDLLDKLVLRQLHLMEDKICCELNVETSINNGSIHLAKSRYIMGQSSVSKERLPTESSAEFSASVTCDTIVEDNVKQLKIAKTDTSATLVNPLNWFGVLVPQNLHKARDIFQNTINFVIDCVNIQIQILENIKNIKMLKMYKVSIINKST
ncbi:coiled-coil domain-containing protein 115 [Nymphalis io]|uniref:coiled-coil domain-containing protein 115 n=1 Tax=Inachis io TaxID=171585 RepID=UPI0021683364|nr:coiled-coil domain-containing protein 115 [Nymphalis io]